MNPARPAVVLAGILLAAANLRAGTTAVGPVLDEVQADQRLSSLTAAALISLPLLAFAVVSPVAPGIARRLGLERPAAAGPSPWRTALGWQVTGFMALQSTAYFVFITWSPSIERTAGVGATAAGFHQLLLNVFAVAGSICTSFLLPRFRDQRAIAVTIPALLVVAYVGTLGAPGLGAVWASLVGLAGGSSIVLALSFFGLRTANHAQAAALSGMAQSVGYLVAAAGPIAVGALHDHTGSWKPALSLMIALQFALAGFGYLAGRRRFIG